MHELYIAESILTSTRESLPAEVPAESVRQIWVQVGRLDAVVPETLIFMFDAIKSSHGMPGAELSLESIEVLCRCGECGNEFEMGNTSRFRRKLNERFPKPRDNLNKH